jgi:hypothetical protein
VAHLLGLMTSRLQIFVFVLRAGGFISSDSRCERAVIGAVASRFGAPEPSVV